MGNNEQRNLFIVFAFSLVIMFIWGPYLSPNPQNPDAVQTEQSGQTTATGEVLPPSAGTEASLVQAPVIEERALKREDVLRKSPRIAINTPSLEGSINLEGARFDDIVLKKYRETIDPKSPNIVLFSPKQTERSYSANFLWLSASLSTSALPNEKTLWQADHTELTPQNPVTLHWDNGQGVVFERKISVDDKFMFSIEDSIKNTTENELRFNSFGYISRLIPTEVGTSYYILHEGALGFLGNEGLKEYTLAKMRKEPNLQGRNAQGVSWKDIQGGFLGITEKYWASAIIPNQDAVYKSNFLLNQANGRELLRTEIVGPDIVVAPQGTASYSQNFFAGAKEVHVIDEYQKSLKILNFDRMVDWGWFYFITKYLFLFLSFLNKLFGNFGLSILAVTVVLKIIFLPMANKSYASMAKMKAIQPQQDAIRQRYKDNPQEMQKAIMELFKKEKVNPVAGCWPMLLQIPVFFALYKVLFVTIEMRQAPFFGWIKDLSAPDPTTLFNLFGLLPYDPFSLPVLGHIISDYARLGVWPLVMGITMWIQMKLNPEPSDPVQKQIFGWMPVIFTFMLGNFAAGLVIYWAWNNFLTIIQQGFIMKRHGAKIELWDNLKSTFKRKEKTLDK